MVDSKLSQRCSSAGGYLSISKIRKSYAVHVFQRGFLFPRNRFIWSNYSDLTRPHPKWWFSKGDPWNIIIRPDSYNQLPEISQNCWHRTCQYFPFSISGSLTPSLKHLSTTDTASKPYRVTEPSDVFLGSWWTWMGWLAGRGLKGHLITYKWAATKTVVNLVDKREYLLIYPA